MTFIIGDQADPLGTGIKSASLMVTVIIRPSGPEESQFTFAGVHIVFRQGSVAEPIQQIHQFRPARAGVLSY